MFVSCSKCGGLISQRVRFCPECGAKNERRDASDGGARDGDGDAAPVASKPTSAAPAARKRVWRSLALATVFGVPFWIAMYVFVFSGEGCSKARGSLTAKALAKAGDFTFAPKLCKSGQHMAFHGVALFEKKGGDPVVTVVKSHLEPTYVLLDPPSCGKPCRVKLTPAECTRFDAAVERTSTTVNDIRLLDGHLRLGCQLPGGATVAADLTYESCD